MNERGVGAVFEQAPYKVRKEILVRAHWCVGAHGRQVRNIRTNGLEKHLAHSVQALKFVLGLGGCQFQHRGNG